jgi:hypothetical protein
VDDRRFDRWVRGLTEDASRRGLLGGLLGGAAAVVAGAELGEARNGHNRNRNNRNKGKRKGKGKGQQKVQICHNGQTITVARPAARAHLDHGDTPGPCGTTGNCLPVTRTQGDVTRTNGNYTATTTGSRNFGNLVIDVPDGTKFGDLETLEADFDFSLGKCGVGSPRFVVFLENGRCPYAQFPPEECNTEGADGETGNLIGNDVAFVWNDDLCGGNQSNNTYAKVLTAYANEEIDRIILVTDTSSGEATVTLDPCVTLD